MSFVRWGHLPIGKIVQRLGRSGYANRIKRLKYKGRANAKRCGQWCISLRYSVFRWATNQRETLNSKEIT